MNKSNKSKIKNQNSKKGGFPNLRNLMLNVLIIIVLATVIIFITFRWINSYTKHSEYIQVPQVVDMDKAKAAETLINMRLRYIISDFRYDSQRSEGEIIEQRPSTGAMVKEGRIIYLTANSGKQPVKTIPDVADNSSLRAAESKLKAAGFNLTAHEYIAGDADWVYQIKYKGDTITHGVEIPEGSYLTIVVGNGNPIEIIERADSIETIEQEFFGE